jgi:hypothetical protein
MIGLLSEVDPADGSRSLLGMFDCFSLASCYPQNSLAGDLLEGVIVLRFTNSQSLAQIDGISTAYCDKIGIV